MKSLYPLLTLLILLLFSSCDAITGKEVARLAINEVSTDDDNLIVKETTLTLKKDDKLSIWSDMDIEYEGDVGLLFRIDIEKNGEQHGGFEINPFDKNITIGEVKTTINNKTKWRFSGKNITLTIEDDGDYTYKGILIASDNPSLIINKAALVFKQ